ncbi:MAG: sigma-70 family RNA polymerase sigma factor [Clostridiales bacterium]|jgi:RNA polymerase sigma-70 factor (ECF subfamily)|nr:sigma-70 family RNA polymerase sigma factor [Clostridiales bacterium]
METIAAISENPRAKIQLDAALLESIYRQYYKNVYNYIAFRINNHFDAEELSALVFEKAVGKWGSYNPAYAVEGWLIGIAKNTVTDYLRVNKRRHLVALDSVTERASPSKLPEEIAVANEASRALIAAMAQLKDTERQILSMKFATDLKHREIAEILGMGESSVGVTVHRALKKLRKILEEDGA